MQKSKKLVFFGTEDFSLPSLVALFEAGYEIAAVVTKPDSARGRSKQLVQPAVKTFALAKNITVLQPQKLADIHDELIKLNAMCAVLVSYGKLLPQRTLDVFEPIGVVNVHPSLLPKYRGPAPIEAAIKYGDKTTGLSIMKLTVGMDEGPVYIQTDYTLTGNETRLSLSKVLADEGAKLLVEVLPRIVSGELKPKPQQNSDVSYTSLISRADGILDPLTDDAYSLERLVRAYQGFPKSRLTLDKNDVIVTIAKVVTGPQDAPLVITCKDNTYLAIEELIAPSGKVMSAEAYLRGYRPKDSN